MQSARPASPAAALHGAFFLSGAGALAFETVWFSQAGLVVGNSVWCAALVAGAFMAGLALGNGIAMRLSPRLASPLRAYAIAEIVAAASGLALVAGFPALPGLVAPALAPLLGHEAALDAARLAVTFALLGLPATALGATLPLVVKPLEALTGSFGEALGRLYAANTLGAVAGTMLAELAFIPRLGLLGSGAAAAACNLAAALIAWRLSRAPLPAPPAPAPLAPGRLRLLAAALLAGAAFLALEVVAFRLLLLYLDGTTLIFAVMLATALAGIALGGLAASMLARRGRLGAGAARAAACAAAAVVVIGCAGIGGLARALSPYAPGSAFAALVLCAALLAPAALASGFVFTALGARLREGIADAGAAAGALTLANTLGAMLGSLAAAFALLPLAGLERASFGLALAYGALALLAPPGGGRWRLAPLAAPALALALFPFGRMPADTDRWIEAHFGGKLVAEREGAELSAFILRQDFLGEPLYYRLAANSVSMASTAVGVQRYMKLFAWLPAALHPGIESALVLCFGIGNTARAVADLPGVRSIDVVDTSRAILALSGVALPDPARDPLRDPRVRVHVEDARFFLQAGGRRYDLVTGEPPPPKMAGVAFLYTREYFSLLRSRLNPHGIATYWLPAYLVLQDEALAIIRAFCDAFEDCSLWSGINRDWILMGSAGGIAPVSREDFSRLWSTPGVGEELRRLGIDSPLQLAGQFMADAASLRELTRAVPPLDDDHPRRVRAELHSQASTPAYTWLMDASRGRRRLLDSDWAKILPAEVVADSRPQFLRRELLEQAYNPDLRRAGYNLWSDVAYLVRETDLVELPRWLLGSGARVAEIARSKGWANPMAAEHLAIDALARRQPPPPVDHARFAAMTAKGQWVSVFHQCLAGDRARANVMLGWLREPDPALLDWAARACAPP